MTPIAALGPQKKDGNCPVYLFVYIKGDRIKINTHVSIVTDKFDIKAGKIIGKTSQVKDQNLIIEKCRARINEIEIKFRLRNIELSAVQFRNEYNHPSADVDFLAWMDTEIKILKNIVGPRRIIKYNTVKNKLKEFRYPISFSEIDRFFIEDYRGWCKVKKDNDISTISTNLNVIKTFTNRALRKNLIEIDPFADIKIGRAAVDRTFLSEEELKLLWCIYKGVGNFEISLKTHLRLVLRHFLFMCFTGLRISDFTEISNENISNGTLRLYPVKTRSKKKQLVKIPLCEQAKRLIADEGFLEGKLFHPISEQRMNTNLKEIAALAQIKKPITNHSARHTFATLFIKKTSDVATLQRLLGHSRIEETMVYVHISEENLVNGMKKFEDGLNFDV